jgi:DNA polymerase-3 subunit epsilon
MAAILESTEIKKWWPQFNYSQKKPEELYGIFMYEDQNGYLRLAIEKKRKNNNPVYTFNYKVDGYGVMKKLIKSYSLCPRLCFIQTDNETCTGILEQTCNGACEKKEFAKIYNERVLEAISSLTKRPSYVFLDKGIKPDEISCILVSNGSFFGMGYLPKGFDNITFNSVAEYIKPYKENSHIRTLLHSHFSNFPQQVTLIPGDQSSH